MKNDKFEKSMWSNQHTNPDIKDLERISEMDNEKESHYAGYHDPELYKPVELENEKRFDRIVNRYVIPFIVFVLFLLIYLYNN